MQRINSRRVSQRRKEEAEKDDDNNKKDMKKDDQEGTGKTQFKGGSPLALEGTKLELSKNRTLLESLHKKLVFQSQRQSQNIL